MLVIGCTRTKLTASRNLSPICFVPILSPSNTNLSYGDYVCSCQENAYTTVLSLYTIFIDTTLYNPYRRSFAYSS